jgi:hypothetical protein
MAAAPPFATRSTTDVAHEADTMTQAHGLAAGDPNAMRSAAGRFETKLDEDEVAGRRRRQIAFNGVTRKSVGMTLPPVTIAM